MRSALFGLMVALSGLAFAGCASHTYATPVVVTVQQGPDQTSDVAWIVEDEGRIVRCVNGPDRPVCRRANVD